MIVYRMRARFGKLNGELRLDRGMNLLALPNESGKSTWSAFLAAMLYGIDTSERAGKNNDNLPAKERYRPWDGGAMEGSVELEHGGRYITIERTGTQRAPFGAFRAFDTHSGAPIPELTGENCGRILCGVERSVFERTAFIRQLGLGISADAALEKRLSALVSTGEEGARSYTELEKALRNLKNKCAYRGGGQIPALEGEISERKRRLDVLQNAQAQTMELNARVEAAEKKRERMTALETRVARAQTAKKRESLAQLRAALDAQEKSCAQLDALCSSLPDEQKLMSLQRRLDAADSTLGTARMDAAVGLGDAPVLQEPPYFAGLTPEAAQAQIRADEEICRSAETVRQPKKLAPVLLCVLLIAAGAALAAFLHPLIGGALALAGAVALAVCLVLSAKKKRAVRQARQRAAEVLDRYGVDSPERLAPLAQDYAQKQAQYHRESIAYCAEKQRLSDAVIRAEQTLAQAVAEVACFAPDCCDTASARSALSAALKAHDRRAAERRSLEAQRRQFAAMQSLFDAEPTEAPDPEALRYDPAQVRRERENAETELTALTAQLAHRRGELSMLGDPVVLRAELEELMHQLADTRERYEALCLAAETLSAADAALRSRFSPKITSEAGAILTELTEGKYGELLLSPEMRLSVREPDGRVMRPAAAMSCGTADQMYLALRLAMCHHLLPAGVPLILDDALVNFDAQRTAAALRVLRREAETRQILLFSCRKLEA